MTILSWLTASAHTTHTPFLQLDPTQTESLTPEIQSTANFAPIAAQEPLIIRTENLDPGIRTIES